MTSFDEGVPRRNKYKKYTRIAHAVITTYLGAGMKPEGYYDITEMSKGNNKVLLEHVKALHNIFGMAIEELEDDLNGEIEAS